MQSCERSQSSIQEYWEKPSDLTGREAVERLNSIFDPLVLEFVSQIRALDTEDLATLRPAGGSAYKSSYARATTETKIRYFHVPYASFTHFYKSKQLGGTSDLSLCFPIGEYGERLAQAGVEAGRAVNGLISSVLWEACSDANRQNGQVIQFETFQGDTLDTLREGNATNVALSAVYAAQKVEGFEVDPIGLLRTLHRDGLYNQFGALNGIGKIVPMVLYDGVHFDRPFVQIDKYAFSSRLKGAMVDGRQRELVREKHGQRGRGCPAARNTIEVALSNGDAKRTSGIDLFAGVYLDILEHYYNSTTFPHETLEDLAPVIKRQRI